MNKNMKASSWYLFGNLFDKAIAFLTIPVFTRMLTTAEYGIVDTYLSYVTILSIMLGLSMESSIQTAYFDFEGDIDSYLSTIIIGACVFTSIFSGMIVLGIHVLRIEVQIDLVLLAMLQGFMTYVLNAAKMYYMMRVKYIHRVILMSVPHTLIAFLSVWGIMICNTDKYMGRIVPYALIMAIFGLVVMIYFVSKAKYKLKKTYLIYAVKYSLPLIFHGLSLQILAQFDKIMLTSMRGAAETGIYSLIYNVGLISQVFTNAFDNAWLPWYQRKMAEKNTSSIINKNAEKLVIIVAVLAVGIVIGAPEIIKFLAAKEYWSGIPMVVPIIWATYIMFLYTLEVHTEYCYKRTKQIPFYTAAAAGINVALNYILIPHYGAAGAAYTTLIAYTISFIFHYCAAHKCDKEVLPIRIFLIPTLMVLAGSVVMILFIDHWILRWIIDIIIAGIFIIYAAKKDLLHTMLSE